MSIAGKQVFECHDPAEFPDLIAHPVGSQKIAGQSMGPDYAQRDAAGGQLPVQLMQHSGSGEVGMG